VVVGLAVLLRSVVGAELADPQHLEEEAGTLDFQSFEEEADVAGSVMVVQSLTSSAPWCPLGRVPC
jgi:hypothetical protein